MKLYQKIFGKAHSEAVYKTRWVTTRVPNAASATRKKYEHGGL